MVEYFVDIGSGKWLKRKILYPKWNIHLIKLCVFSILFYF